jgi:hypothetical protein
MLRPLLLVSFASAHLSAQAVVSTHSGIVNYAEGSAFLDDSPVNPKFGTFPSITEGSTLRTEKGRAEVLLTPGVFLRIDENSAIRMISSVLSNTRVEFLHGAAIIDSNDATSGNPCVLVYKTFQIRFPKPGVYRLGSEPEVFQTYTGEAEIQEAGEPPKAIDESNQFFFGIGTEVKKYGDGTVDAFSEWARNRAETIAADNRVGSPSTADPDSSDGNNFPFVLPAPSSPAPWFGQPGSGQPDYRFFSGAMWANNGFLGPWGPYAGSPFLNPLTVIYVFPRHFYGHNPISGTPPRRPGYPQPGYPRPGYPAGYPRIVPPVRTSYPRPSPYRPTPMPLRSTYSYARPSVGYAGAGAPRVAQPQPRMASPNVVRPMAMPRR